MLKGGVSGSCTSLAATPQTTLSNHTLIGQNADQNVIKATTPVIFEMKQKGKPNIVRWNHAGTVGNIGFNSKGIALCANALVCNKWHVAVPVEIIMRGILNAEYMTDAFESIFKVDRASSCNFLMAHAGGEIIDIEAAPHEVNIIFSDDGILTHSNHFTVANCKIKDFSLSVYTSTLFRKHRADKLLKEKVGQIIPGTFMEILRDHFDKPHSTCRHPDKRLPESEQKQTVASLVMDINERILHISKGPPCENGYSTYKFQDL
jgi:isopenicillin-N N-acyltransferase-like protein